MQFNLTIFTDKEEVCLVAGSERVENVLAFWCLSAMTHSCLELCFCQDGLTQFLVVFSCTKYIHLVPSFSKEFLLAQYL